MLVKKLKFEYANLSHTIFKIAKLLTTNSTTKLDTRNIFYTFYNCFTKRDDWYFLEFWYFESCNIFGICDDSF